MLMRMDQAIAKLELTNQTVSKAEWRSTFSVDKAYKSIRRILIYFFTNKDLLKF